MKKLLSLLLAFCGFMAAANAQLVVKINDKIVAENATVNTEDISKMEISFSNLKKIKSYSLGRLVFEIVFTDLNGANPMEYNIVKTGENAIDGFLSEASQRFMLYEKDGANDAFRALVGYDSPKGVRECLDKLSSEQSSMKFKVKASIYFQDKVSYDTYGDHFDLAKPVNFKINNMRADGAVVLGGSGGVRLSAAAITATNYFSSFPDKNVIKAKIPGFSTTDVSHTCL
ncbi:MAG: hypothetical protein RI894_724, partial [Bacteroidota bacterium]